jgi:hypothetical protein
VVFAKKYWLRDWTNFPSRRQARDICLVSKPVFFGKYHLQAWYISIIPPNMLVQSLNQYFLANTTYKHGIFLYNSTLYKNAGFSLDKSYAIFPQILWFSPIFPSPWYFFPAILSAVVFFRNTTAGGKIPCLKIDRD